MYNGLMRVQNKYFVFAALTLVNLLFIILVIIYTYKQAMIVIEWEMASGFDAAGFYIYRSEQYDGPYILLNTGIMPAGEDPFASTRYRYEDKDVFPGNTYHYIVEEVNTQGATFRNDPLTAICTLDYVSAFLIWAIFMVFSGSIAFLALRSARTAVENNGSV